MGGFRPLALAALVAALAAVAVLLLGGTRDDYRVVAVAQDAGQLVKGNLVKIGGVTAGELERIVLDDRNRARLVLRIDEERFRPLHRGTTATIRATSLSSVAGRVVSLHPGPNDAPAIEDGGAIPAQDTQAVVELDQIVNTLDASTRAALQEVVHGGADALAGRGPATRRAL